MTSFRYPTTIQELVARYKEEASLYKRDLSAIHKEDLASHMVGCVKLIDDLPEWCDEYPMLAEIDNLAGNLEWSNSLDVDEDWQKLIAYINKLDEQVNGSK